MRQELDGCWGGGGVVNCMYNLICVGELGKYGERELK